MKHSNCNISLEIVGQLQIRPIKMYKDIYNTFWKQEFDLVRLYHLLGLNMILLGELSPLGWTNL